MKPLALASLAVAAVAAPLLAGCTGEAGPADAGGPVDGGSLVVFDEAEWSALEALSPETLPPPPADVSNRFADDPDAAALGKQLFFETRFSGKLLDGDDDGSVHTLGTKGQTGRVACAGCHIPSAGFLDNRTLGEQITLAAGWGLRRTPSLLDVGQAKLLMWDGRRDALFNQPFGPMESPVEMNSSRLFLAEQIFALYRPSYEAVFGPMPPLDDTSRFPPLSAELTGCQPSTVDPVATCNGTRHGMPGDGAEFDGMSPADQLAVDQVAVNFGKALGAYERKLSCGPGRFDAWVHGDSSALTEPEKRGAQLFVSAGCTACHSGPYFSDQKFHDVGLQPGVVAVVFTDSGDEGAASGLSLALADPFNTRGRFSDGDDGRLPAALPASMSGAFRTPSLRCVSQRPSFMHTGQFARLSDVVAFFAQGGNTFGYTGVNELVPLSLSDDDQANLTAFLGTLAGPGPDPSLTTPSLEGP